MRTSNGVIPGSFRDPSGFVFLHDGSIYRQVNDIYRAHYDRLIDSGLYKSLSDAGLMLPHAEVDPDLACTEHAYKILKPEFVSFISYPYEWCFSQLRDAALTTLQIQKTALEFGMILKDSSAYNIQFVNGKPTLIDTCSFETYQDGQIWVAYRQFCQHFLAPLALMCYRDIRLNQLFRIYIDGVPLDLASSLLPVRTWLRFPLLSHIHFHARGQKHFADKPVNTRAPKMKRLALLSLIDNLESAINRLTWQPQGTEWADYYEDTNYSAEAFQHKTQLVSEFLDQVNPGTVWALGANRGVFSRIAGDKGIQTIAFDIDPACVEQNYRRVVEKGEVNLLPLVLDLTNPSPNIGWEHQERMSFLERGPTDAVLALALIHHLAIANNLPLNRLAGFFNKICQTLIIEFVPKHDSQVQRLLSGREDIFPDYTQPVFETEFKKYFPNQQAVPLRDSERTLYLMQK